MALILLADDDPLIAEIVKATLNPKGHIVGVLPDGQGIAALVELKRPALVILDCAMPIVGGVEALRKIRASKTCSQIPVLMLTARTSSADEAIAMEAGANDYLRKPFHPDQLAAWVDCLIDPHSHAALVRRAASVSDSQPGQSSRTTGRFGAPGKQSFAADQRGESRPAERSP